MERIVKLGLYCDYYGQLLTERQLEACRLQGDEDRSLSEIAEELGISRQAVHDLIRRSQEQMEALEAALGLVEKGIAQDEALGAIEEEIRLLAQEIGGQKGSRLLELAAELSKWR